MIITLFLRGVLWIRSYVRDREDAPVCHICTATVPLYPTPAHGDVCFRCRAMLHHQELGLPAQDR